MPTPRKTTEYAPSRNARLPEETYSQQGVAVFLTVRAYQGRPFGNNKRLCQMVVEQLAVMRVEYGCWIGAYCLMPNHLHLVSGPVEDGRSVLTFLDRFKGKSTNKAWETGWQGRLWQGRSHDHVIRRADGLENVYAYILNNPVRARLVEQAESWPWCGIMDHYEW